MTRCVKQLGILSALCEKYTILSALLIFKSAILVTQIHRFLSLERIGF